MLANLKKETEFYIRLVWNHTGKKWWDTIVGLLSHQPILQAWYMYEPPHDKTNNMACAPREDSDQPGQSSLCAQWVAKVPTLRHVDSKDSDQTGQMPRLIWVFAGRTPYCWFCRDAARMLLCWGLTSQSTIFQSCWDGAIASWVINQYFRGVKCLAQGHNTAEVGLEPRTSRSEVRHSTTEPPRSPCMVLLSPHWAWCRIEFPCL